MSIKTHMRQKIKETPQELLGRTIREKYKLSDISGWIEIEYPEEIGIDGCFSLKQMETIIAAWTEYREGIALLAKKEVE